MKRLLLLISFIIICLFSFTQTNIQQDNRVNPLLKRALGSKSGYYIYGRADASALINIAVLNDSSHTLCWFTCHGRLIDSTKLTRREYEQVTQKHLDPFLLYKNICDKYLAYIATAKDIYRVYGDKQLFDRLNSNYRALLAMETVQKAKTPLQKLIAIENIRKSILTQLAYLNCANPIRLVDNPLYRINKEKAGAMIQTKDSTVYYNIDPTSAVARISLYKTLPKKLYVYNRLSELVDSVPVLPEKYDLLLKEKTDVFLLYRGWLELRWQASMDNIRRHKSIDTIDVSVYSRVNIKDEQSIDKELYSQLNAIETRINLLILPEAKSIEQAVYDTYKNETSEISYIPLLGIAYETVLKRGEKEYELTNHLGNVLATVSDKKIGVSSPSNSSLIDHYEPDIVSAQDYYPFGMLQPGRSYLSATGDKYRYGFNGKESDNEVKGEGNQQDYGMRVYDPRLGRFLSVDPITKDFPELTPYQFANNTPIQSIDLDGLEDFHYTLTFDKKKGSVLRPTGVTEIRRMFSWLPKSNEKRAIVKYNSKTYHIGFTGDPNEWEYFRLWKAFPQAEIFEKLFPSDEDQREYTKLQQYEQSRKQFATHFLLGISFPVGQEFEPVAIKPKDKYDQAKGGKELNKEIKKISNGGGTLRYEDDGVTPKIFENRNNTKLEQKWEGAVEYQVLVDGEANKVRILKKFVTNDANGNPQYMYGWTRDHYESIHDFIPKPPVTKN